MKSNIDLVDMQTIDPRIIIDLRYATINNFTTKVIYSFCHCYLLRKVAYALKDVQDELKFMNLGLKIWDGYRPLSAQKLLWNILPDERYIANPLKGGKHTRGTAVDLTIVDNNKKELSMPSDFDEFNEKAHRYYKGVSKEKIKNRELLQEVMEKHGFIGLETEWWHFDFKGWEKCLPMDIIPQL